MVEVRENVQIDVEAYRDEEMVKHLDGENMMLFNGWILKKAPLLIVKDGMEFESATPMIVGGW